MPERTNRERADSGLAALDAHAGAVYDDPEEAVQTEPMGTRIVDLVADLMHLASRAGVAWEDVLRLADDHFRSEGGRHRGGDPREWRPGGR